MLANPTLTIKVGSHTDSRCTAAYNLWLSQRRVDRISNYLVAKGIDARRLTIEDFGEEHLTNECDNHTYCSASKHKMNRRSKFMVIGQ